MSKLLYATSLAGFKTAFSDWASTSSAVYNTLSFIGDGYFATHGKLFKVPITSGDAENIYDLAVSISKGSLSVSLGGYTQTASLSDAFGAGTYLTKTLSNGTITYSHQKVADSGITGTLVGSSTTTATDASATVIGGVIYDEYGHVSGATSRTLTLNKVLSQKTSTSTAYYILGHSKASDEETAITYKDSRVYFKDGTLYVNNLNVNGSEINDLISASQALYFKGTVSKQKDLPTSGVQVGDLYVVDTTVALQLVSGDTTYEQFEPGDMIICTSASPITWSGIQRNIDGVLTDSNLSGTTSGLKLAVSKSDGNLFVTQTYRPVSVAGTPFLTSSSTTTLNFAAGTGITLDTGTAGTIKITNSSPLSNAESLSIKVGDNIVTYNPSSAASTVTFAADGDVSVSYSSDKITYSAASYELSLDSTSNAIKLSNGTKTTSIVLGDFLSIKDGKLTSANTWRTVGGYSITSNSTLQTTTLGAVALTFGDEFALTSSGTVNLIWAEVDESGTVTYHA